MAGISLIIADIETTGLKHNYHDLVEISMIRYDSMLQISRIVKADNPNRASFDALKITAKSIDDLYMGISKKQMVADIEDFLLQDGLTAEHRCIVGHNIGFDRSFIHHIWGSHDREFPASHWLDTLAICRRVAKDRGLGKIKLNLHAACDLFGIKKIAEAHTAKMDTRNNYLLMEYFINNKIPYLDLIKRIPHYQDDE